jgi:hypothetical protein
MMDLTPWLKSIEDSGLATGIRSSLYDFPFLEAAHVMAFSLVFGTVAVVDLRLLGLASTGRSAVRVSSELLKWTWAAFAVVVVTGAIMFTTNARVYVHDTAFLIKMALLALAGINMAAFHLAAARTMPEWDRRKAAPGIGKAAAALSLLLWIGIVVAGRVVGFTTTGAQAKETAPPPAAANFDDFLNGGPSSGPPAPPASPAPK